MALGGRAVSHERGTHVHSTLAGLFLCDIAHRRAYTYRGYSHTRSTTLVGGGVRIHPENARMSGRHGVQYVAQCVACAALAPVVWQ